MHRLLSAAMANYVVVAVQAASLLVLAPLIIHRDGQAEFGAWTLIVAIGGYVRLLELGFGPAVTRFVASEPTEARRSVVVSSATVTAAAGGALTALAGGIAALGIAALSSGDQRSAIALGAGVLCALRGLQLPLTVSSYELYGRERIVARGVLASLRTALWVSATVVGVLLGLPLVAYVALAGVAEVVASVGQTVYVRRSHPACRVSRAAVERETVRALVRFSVPMFGFTGSTQAVLPTQTLIVGAFAGATAAAGYGVAVRVVEGTLLLLSQAGDVLLPRMSGEDDAGRRRYLSLGTRLSVVAAFALASVLIAFGPSLLRIWLGTDVPRGGVILALLSGSLLFNGPLRVVVLAAIGAGRHAAIARLSIYEAVGCVLLSLTLCPLLGPAGVALASLVSFSVSNGWIIPRMAFPLVDGDARTMFWRPLGCATVVAAPMTAALAVVVASTDPGRVTVLAGSAAWTLLVAGALTRALVSATERRRLQAALGRRAAATVG